MIVNRDRKRLLRDLLADHILIERAANLGRLRNPNIRGLPPRVFVQLLIEDALADVDATVANIDAGTGDQLAHLRVAFATEGAHCEVGSASHGFASKEQFYSSILRGKAASAIAVERSGTAPSSSFASLRDLITSSTSPYSLASAADM